MFSKNKVLDKIIEGYLGIFFLFSIIATNVVLDNWLDSMQILNRFTSFIVLLVTLSSHLGIIVMNYKEAKEKKEGD